MAKQVRGVTLYGDEYDNTSLIGTAGADVILGLGGNDFIDGLAGNDDLRGHEGNDTIEGGAGDDLLGGHDGNDHLMGEDGNDQLYGGTGNDTLNGGAGNDMLSPGGDSDWLTGGSGADQFKFIENWDPFLTRVILAGTNVHTITDFSRSDGDTIDLTLIDADGDTSNNTRKGNTDFTVVATPTGAAGEAWMQALVDPVTGLQTGVSIYLNYDSDAEADTRIDVLGVTTLTWGVDIFGGG